MLLAHQRRKIQRTPLKTINGKQKKFKRLKRKINDMQNIKKQLEQAAKDFAATMEFSMAKFGAEKGFMAGYQHARQQQRGEIAYSVEEVIRFVEWKTETSTKEQIELIKLDREIGVADIKTELKAIQDRTTKDWLTQYNSLNKQL